MSFFDIHEKINRGIYRSFNIASNALFLSRGVLKNELQKNLEYKNKHDGERCFILATGPSINDVDPAYMSMLGKETVFGVNSLYKSRAANFITPKYYSLMDNIYWGRSIRTFKDIVNTYSTPPTFITDVRARQYVPEGIHPLLVYAKHYPTQEMRYDFSGNISITMNVVSFSILAAMYMGFREINLLGLDYNLFCSPSNNHCYDDSNDMNGVKGYNLSFYLKYYHLTTEFHYLIARTALRDGIAINNLSEGSLLDAYPRRHISEILKLNKTGL